VRTATLTRVTTRGFRPSFPDHASGRASKGLDDTHSVFYWYANYWRLRPRPREFAMSEMTEPPERSKLRARS